MRELEPQIEDLSEQFVEDLLLKMEQCDSLHNNCDFLLEHSDIDYLLMYIKNLKEKIKSNKKEGE